MYQNYLITGATGFLGRAIVEELVRRNERVDALVLHNDPCAALLPEGVHTVIGNVCEDDSLAQFFADADRQHFKNQINDLVRTPHIRNGVIRFPQRTAAQKIHRRKQQPHISDRKNDQCHRNSSRKLPR